MSFKTSIRVEDDAVFGAIITRNNDLMISLDGPFVEGTIVLKISQEQWGNLCGAVMDAAMREINKKGY